VSTLEWREPLSQCKSGKTIRHKEYHMNKKRAILILAALLLVTLCVAAPLTVADAAKDDFKVIKKAVDKGESNPAVANPGWLKIEVTGKVDKHENVRLKIPLSLIDFFADCIPQEELRCDHGDLDLKKLLQTLKKSGPQTLIEIDSDDETIRIWLE